MADLAGLIVEFTQLPDANCGHGPNHPLVPDVTLASDLASLLASCQHLERYPDFVRLLGLYAGIAIASDKPRTPFLALFGLGNFDDEFSEPIVADRFHVFAESYSNAPDGTTVHYAFAFLSLIHI